jgi:hypothetical protein
MFAIDTEEDDVTGTVDAPVAEAVPVEDEPQQFAASDELPGPRSDTPAEQAPLPRPRPKQADRSGISGAVQDVVDIASDGQPHPIKRIVGYLMGEGAAPPQALNVTGQQIDPEGSMSPSDRNLLAVEKVAREAGSEEAWKLVQANRVSFNAKQSFALAALNGSPQKPPDIRAAIDAANQAQSNILDGSDVRFEAGPRGVTATVRNDDGSARAIELTPEQFRRYLNVGGDGQWDRLMQNGVPSALERIATMQTGNKRIADNQPLPQQRPRVAGPQPQQAPQQPQQPKTSNIGQTPSTLNLSGDNRARPTEDESGYSPELRARANRIFPYASQAADAERWMAGQAGADAERSTRVQVARETGTSRVAAADARGEAGVRTQEAKNAGNLAVQTEKNRGWQYASDAKLKAAQAQLGQRVKEMEAKNANAEQTRALKAIQTKLMTATTLTPQEQKYVDGLPGAAEASNPVTRPPSPQQSAPQQQAPDPKQPPVQGAKLWKGQWYVRGPNGESVPYQQ